MQRNLTPCLAGLSAALWSLVAVMIATFAQTRILLAVIGLTAALTAITGIALVFRVTDDERRQERDAGYQVGYSHGAVENARALMQGANVSIMPHPRTSPGSTCADPRCDVHDPRASDESL